MSDMTSEDFLTLGKEYALGSRLHRKDLPKSVECFRKAGEMGNIRGIFRHALSIFEGEGVPKNRDLAQKMARKVIPLLNAEADENKTKSIQTLADAYSFGLGVPQDLHRAYELYLEASILGDKEAQCSLGFCYFDGLGVEKNVNMGARWWTISASQGYPHACCDIGVCYLSGIGVKKDVAEAIRWFTEASESNYSPGSSFMGRCYYFGIGVKKNPVKAAEYYSLALMQDYDRGCRSILSDGLDLREFLDSKKLRENLRTSIHGSDDIDIVDGCVYLSRAVTSINTDVLADRCIRKIIVEPDNPNYRSIDGCLYDKAGATLLLYPRARPLKDYCQPESLKSIQDLGFFDELIALAKQE